jgi:hypothetical protein
MGDNVFAKFNEMFDLSGLQQDIAAAASNTSDFVEVPDGNYEVKVTKIEAAVTSEKSKTPGMPMMKVWFDILAGDFKGQKIFCNQMLTSGFGIHKASEMLTAFESGVPVVFENFDQFADVMAQVFTAIDGTGEYELAYGHNNKGFATYTIVQRFHN